MAKLIYFTLISLDGYIEDKTGKFDWAVPDDDVHAFANDLIRGAGTFLYGRRMYETMKVWQTAELQAPVHQDFAAVWRAADKIVFSTTLKQPATPNTRIERQFVVSAVRQLKESSARDVFIGGPTLAAQAFRAGLVDECQLFVVPVIVGGGKRGLPSDAFLMLELVEERRFGNVVCLGYRTCTGDRDRTKWPNR